ncbi:5-oxoprolinase (ATP-hydrolysing) [Paragonimus westermani]|uniref:5-oxoprolinase (ATP-hydrolysing) n=1 Tax=Paragonimus westermani TaxID=34504 RepID=A0A5J4NSY5_9TREM|nr:5-oxoprolinase (ATP-hydrolysing) [Paragonimus westermani]
MGYRFAIDRGGTFTDVYARCPNGKVRVLKLLSQDPGNYDDAPLEAIRRIIESKVEMPDVLHDDVIEIEERILLRQDTCQLNHNCPTDISVTGEQILIATPLDRASARIQLDRIFNAGIRSLAVVLMHSYLYPKHELALADIAHEVGFTNISLSHRVMPMIKIVPRAFTATADSYLTPCIKRYVESFSSGFCAGSKKLQVLFMLSDGGLSPADDFLGSRAILSGPAGGVIGYAMTAYTTECGQPVVGFDMGGTSTDVSRYGGELEHVFETTTAGLTIQAPQLNISTVAAGGGSCLSFRCGMYQVGPESAGAFPGPVAYGHPGGKLSVTDANLILGRLLPAHFPALFGPEHNAPLDTRAARHSFEQLATEINTFTAGQHSGGRVSLSVEEVALGFVRVANETMCRPIRSLTQGKGYDTSKHILACFGGAGGQHACSIARLLGIKKVVIHRYAGILSAYGMALADVVREQQLPCQLYYKSENFVAIDNLITQLISAATTQLTDEGFDASRISCDVFLHMRYEGTDGALMCQAWKHNANSKSLPVACSSYGDFERAFVERYKLEFGFALSSREIIVDDVRVRGRAVSDVESPTEIPRAPDGEHPRPLIVSSPLIVTVLIEPNCEAVIMTTGDIEIHVHPETSQSQLTVSTQLDAVQLSIFSHRFMSIAEQMGRVLQRTAISTNIKERLDFSCALFDNTGGLVANAPHIPVHLGAMQHAVQYQIEATGNHFAPGEVLLSNHPCAGGSHLPDLTVITPVFIDDLTKPALFVANRGHHADIGGSTPGSMPPHSTSILEEGAVFKTFYLVKDGQFQEEEDDSCHGLRMHLHENFHTPVDSAPQVCSTLMGAYAQGVHLLRQLIDEYSLPVVQAYMKHIQDNAEMAVRHMLRDACLEAKTYEETTVSSSYCTAISPFDPSPKPLSAIDYLDDGTPICLQVSVDPFTGSAHFDFTGTGSEVLGNTNAPQAVLYSCLFYALRCLVGGQICLNHGCLKPIKITVPPGTILSASPEAAVVGGNVLTSQRIVDVILAAFRVCAASQGCMNNVTFGTEKLGYYETVAGGAGAGPGWHGRSGVHTHMTNTRMTDPEILEQRYPVILEHFGIRPGSGGRGRWNGGDGLTRRMRFRIPVTLSVLTERRSLPPYGLFGGLPGARGLNLLQRAGSAHSVNIGGKAKVLLSAGDVFILHTPGGGGFGKPEQDCD